MMHVGYTGTHLGMKPRQLSEVKNLVRRLRPSAVAHGDCIGGDAEFHNIVHRILRCPINIFPPINPKNRAWCGMHEHGSDCCNCSRCTWAEPRGYSERNEDIVDVSTAMIAAPRSVIHDRCRHGTCHAARYTRRQGKTLYIVLPSGSIVAERV